MLNNAGLTANSQPGQFGVHVVLAFQSEIQFWKGEMRLTDPTNSDAALKMPPSGFTSERRLHPRSLTKLVPTGDAG